MNELKFNELKGKKLLILGAYNTEIEIIEEAKRLGVYTIVTDNNEDWSLAPAKKVADEAWDISWTDLSALKTKCLNERVDGCFAGFSEKRVEYAQRICSILKLPFYADGANLKVISNKLQFKQACIDNGIKVPRNYEINGCVEFPVIVKPADNGGSRGITICRTKKELDIAYDKAMKYSDTKEVIIEEYLSTDEIMVYFTIHNGQIELSTMCDRHMQHFDSKITQLPIGYVFPSKHLNVFIEHNYEKYIDLIKHLNIKNGLLAFQAFVVGNDVVPFDPTYRLDGTMSYHIVSKFNGINVLQLLLNYSLTGSMGDVHLIKEKEDPHFSGFGFELPILLKQGVISEIRGLDEIREMKNIIHVFKNFSIGDKMAKSADFTQMLARIHITANDKNTITEVVKSIYRKLVVLDEKNEDMVIGRFPTNLLN